jgi:threonine dehydrogenase-like Zn-dependent dehydrogenase
MKALCWHSKKNVSVDEVPDPKILDPKDVIVKISSTAICGSDLHLYNGIADVEKGDILGHEFMGEVVEIGREVKKLKIGDRVVVPSIIACGECEFCNIEKYALCRSTNLNSYYARKLLTQAPSGVFGFSRMMGSYAGGQAEYVRVPYADVGPLKIESTLTDEQVLFLSDIIPTGYMAAENAEIKQGDTVAVWGCGPVGQFVIQSAWLLGASRVIAIDRIPERLQMAQKFGKAEIIDFSKDSVFEKIMEMTQGEGADACIDAVGTEADTHCSARAIFDRIKQTLKLANDRPEPLRQAIECCKKGGVVSIPGVYFGYLDHIPFGPAMNKGLTLRIAHTNMQKYLPMLLNLIEKKQLDPTFVLTHRMKLKDASAAYDIFNKRSDKCVKVLMIP